MSDLPVPDSAAESLVLGAVVAVIIGLYLLIRRTHARADDAYWRSQDRGPAVDEVAPAPTPISEWAAGDRVWIVAGPHAPAKGDVVAVLADRLVVAVDVPGGRGAPVELPPDAVQRAGGGRRPG